MKKIICFLPFFLFVVIRLLVLTVHFEFYIMLIGFLVAGILLRCEKIIGGVVGNIISLYIFYLGTQNWKLGILEIRLSIILFIFYSFCMIYLLWKKKGFIIKKTPTK